MEARRNYSIYEGGRIMDSIFTTTVNGIYDLSPEEVKAIETLTGERIEFDSNILKLMGKPDPHTVTESL